MQKVKSFLVTFLLFILLVVVGVLSVKYYSFLFAETYSGQIFQIERVTEPSLIMGGAEMSKSREAMYSYAVAIRTKEGEIITASSEDRQWAVARRGLCVDAKFYPYPPWNFEKSGTYFNARLIKLKDCPEDMKPLPPKEEEPKLDIQEELRQELEDVTLPEDPMGEE